MNSLSKIAHQLRVLAAFCALGAGTAHAEGGLPVITAHSQTEFAVYQGDTFGLEVKAQGEDLQYKWVQAKETFCRAKACEVDSTRWGLGSHKIAFVVFNAKGSLYLRYKIKVLAPPVGYAAGKVRPELEIVAEDIETVTSADLAVRTLTGRGFSYHRKKLQVVGPTPRTLDWSEKLRTQAESTMQILRAGREHHVLGPSSAVSLASASSGHRVLVLSRGALRSRQLDGKEPAWSIVFGSWLQIDTDGDGDVVVNRVEGESDQVELYVVRGNARVFRRRSGDSPSEAVASAAKIYGVAGEAITVPQGGYVLLTRDFEAPPGVEAPLAGSMGALIAATTPDYLPNGDMRTDGAGTGVLGDKKGEDLAAAVAMALDAEGKHDFPAAIETLQPFADKVKKDYRGALALGTAYKGMLLDDAAADFLLAASRLKRSAPEPFFLLGEMALAAGHWQKALKFFDTAEGLDYEDAQTLNYYQGVASFYLKEYAGARNQLTNALWDEGEPGVAASADAFRRKVRFDGWFDVRSGLGVLYDDNVLHAHARGAGDLPVGIDSTRSTGYEGHAGFSLWALRGPSGQAGLSFDAKKIGWLEPTLVKVSALDQELALNLGVNSGAGPEKDPEMALEASAFAGTKMFGSQRAADILGGRARMVVTGLAGLALSVRSQTNLDPLPAADDILDPTLGEVVAPSERSNHQTYYGVEVTPLQTAAWTVAAAFDTGTTTMRSDLRFNESYTEKILGLRAGLITSPRNELGLRLRYLARAFPDALDHRADKLTGLGFDWRYHYTTSLYHSVLLDYASQASTRSAASFKAMSVGYHLNFDL